MAIFLILLMECKKIDILDKYIPKLMSSGVEFEGKTRYAAFEEAGRVRLGAVVGEEIIDLSPLTGAATFVRAIVENVDLQSITAQYALDLAALRLSLTKCRLRSPLPDSGKFI